MAGLHARCACASAPPCRLDPRRPPSAPDAPAPNPSRACPTKGDAADITLMVLSTCALVALSMQVYRAYLLASMYAAERF